jgi:arylsulfatase A-like enzyme
MPPRQVLLRGAGAGLRVWLAYGVVEYVAAVARPLVGWRGGTLSDSHWTATSVFLGVYTAAGAIAGIAASWVLHRISPSGWARRLGPAAVATLALACAANVAILPDPLRNESQAEWLAFVAAVVVAAGSLAALVRPGVAERLAWFTNPWAAALMLVGPCILSRPAFTPRAAIFCVVAAAAIAAGLLPAAQRLAAAIAAPRRAWALLAAAAMLAAGGTEAFSTRLPALPPPTGPSAPGLPNVVLIVLDTVRADRMSLYGFERDTTPELKRWGQEATVFPRAMSSSNYTLPSHASLLTGLNAGRHGAHKSPETLGGRPLPSAYPTLAESLSALGYRTLAVIANYGFLNPGFGIDRGFQVYYCPTIPTATRRGERSWLRYRVGQILKNVSIAPALEVEFLRAPEINRNAYALLEGLRTAGGGPFFLFLNYMDAHQGPPRLAALPGPRLSRAETEALRLNVIAGRRRLTEYERHALQAEYDEALVHLDAELGRLLRRLRELQLYENTLIIVTSDHGEALGEGDLIGHGLTLHQHQVHVPLIIKYPRQRQGAVESVLAAGADIQPTILDTIGQPPNPDLDGRSLRNTAALSSRVVISEAFGRSTAHEPQPRLAAKQWALFSGDWKLIEPESGAPVLYNLAQDPREMMDLYTPTHPVVGDMRSRLRTWRSIVARSRHAPSGKVTPEMLERLKALGYVQ